MVRIALPLARDRLRAVNGEVDSVVAADHGWDRGCGGVIQ